MSDALQVVTTTETKADAERIAAALVERRLAACVQIVGPITSTFRWEGKIQTSEEWLCIVKTRRPLYVLVEEAIRELHPYQVPEILATAVVAGSQTYLDWLRGELLTPGTDHE
ncbi:MAG TPA: divalent-cation tolerance protein CutA [Pirellulales bacterium]|nr:divalent-cation tolerance protein CutA [Pirellulales bacterium]